jgi:hypothetical protein
MPTLGLNVSLYLDGLSALFALLVTGRRVYPAAKASFHCWFRIS